MNLLNKSILAGMLVMNVLASCSNSSSSKNGVKNEGKPFEPQKLLKYDPKDADKEVDAFMQHLHKKSAFNGNVLVAKKGKIIYEGAFGWANHLTRDSLKLDSKFELASVSKTMTGTAIMMLWEQGKIKLDQDVRDFYPNFPYEGVTIRLLLTHRSGMMNYVYFVDGLYRKEHRDQKKGITNQQVMNLIAEYKPAPFNKPNVRFLYNNSNYMVLGAIIEKVTGMPYAQYMQENIFKPSGMTHTAVYSKAVYDKIPADVVGHDRNSWRYSVAQNFLDGPVGDKGIYSTIGDLYLFDQALKAGRLIKPATQDSAYAAHVTPLIRGHFSYGYGWRIFEDKNQKVVYHTGWWHGFRHIFLRDLKNDVTIILLGNLVNGSLLHLDDLFKATGMPVVRKDAYKGTGETAED
ncbi:serine hydrolase domain-containing protein [Mucilaginibacter terrae]|uniref:CubicO group peptidase (Beta-lactamase class C family) n=1 Tax=Mucilaginibacter terrae TaxID=1955052 RepID=A0ABU3GVN5_9SPHI|nr:serine hydrolase [Mucilaginibacter terrae]MDT3403831.1 CubicO group peptidase (beta-lactamase class C family) [Mucilaginibacter terrae]